MADSMTASAGAGAQTGAAGGSTALVRGFGWLMLSLLAVFLLNSILTFWIGFPGVSALFAGGAEGGGTALAIVQLVIYALAPAFTFWHVNRTSDVTLRADAQKVADFNAFLIRAAFWVVFLVGLGDAIMSFMRVEGLLDAYLGQELAGDLGRSAFRGLYFHTPLVVIGIVLGAVTRTLGFTWLALLVVVAELLIVVCRFVFSYEQAFMADLVRFWYGALFLFASAYTLLEDGHVRVDLFYAGMSQRGQGLVNSVGSILLGMSVCWTILIFGFSSANAVIVSPILVFEVTQAGFGMYVKYFMAGFLGVFASTMLIQFVSQLFDGVADRRGEPGHRESHAEPL
ncbi:MAG: TRAP transporter small permease subunit [Pseudomonadota bacterium]